MKQHITKKQLQELSKENYLKLRQWADECFPKGIQLLLESSETTLSRYMTIGRMIEFLDEKEPRTRWIDSLSEWENESQSLWDTSNNTKTIELTDWLWEDVKEALDKEAKVPPKKVLKL